jgi:oligoribonuclease NrnB/cAMP/cGMP phosphodiesterase (DHH superfamily)
LKKVCVYHAGCPDGLGAAWAIRAGWGDDVDFIPRGHDDAIVLERFEGNRVLFVDIAPPPDAYLPLSQSASQLVVLDHHVSAQERFYSQDGLAERLEADGHEIHFDLAHSGAMLAWRWMFNDEAPPPMLAYVEDQDLWNWALPDTHEINATICSAPRTFEAWDALAARPVDDLAREGAPIVRSNRIEVERAMQSAHAISVGDLQIEAVNSRFQRAEIGHELASRAAFGPACGAVYRMTGTRVDISIYSIGELNVSEVAGQFGGGGHRNAAGFSVPLEVWTAQFA